MQFFVRNAITSLIKELTFLNRMIIGLEKHLSIYEPGKKTVDPLQKPFFFKQQKFE